MFSTARKKPGAKRIVKGKIFITDEKKILEMLKGLCHCTFAVLSSKIHR